MNKALSFSKKILKVVLWIIISLMLLFIVIALLIQIPAIQNKIVHYATTYVSNKTHTKVEIKRISISFPKSVVIEGLFLEDTKKDTLLYARETKVNLAFRGLFNHEIHITSFSLEEVTLNMNRTETDSLFNFNFLLTAFSDTTKPKIAEPETKSKWTFTVDDVSLKNIQLHFNDDYGGINANANLQQLELTMEKIDIENLIFKIDELNIEALTASVLLKKSFAKSSENSTGVLPVITANKIQINNTDISYGDSISKLSLIAKIWEFNLEEASVNLQKEMVVLGDLSLAKSSIHFNMSDTALSADSTVLNKTTEESDWKVSAKIINLLDNSLNYDVINKVVLKNSFDASHMYYKHISLAATDFYYSSAKTEVSVKSFSAVDTNDFSITQFETDFSMDAHTITAKNLKAQTINSSIDANLNLKFSSLNALADSFQLMIINADLRNVSITNADILYFSPELFKQAFFKNKMNRTTVTGNVSGPVNNLKGENLIIKTGYNTSLKTDFLIIGLPSVEKTYFNFPNLTIKTGKNDIKMMIGSSIPKSIELAENISLQIAFKGQLKSFVTTIGVGSSFGNANIFASIDKNENFKSKIAISNFDLGLLLKDTTSMFGPVSLNAEANGQGLDLKKVKAEISVEVSKLYLNKYTYQNLNAEATIAGQQIKGTVRLNDENAVFDLDALVNLDSNNTRYKLNLNLQGADLKKLNLTKDDLQLALVAAADIKGDSANNYKGNAGVSKVVIVYDEKKHLLDSLLSVSVNESDESKLNGGSAIIGIKYTGSFSPADLSKEFSQYINYYFPFSDSIQQIPKNALQNFGFEIQLHNNPVLSEVFLPQLKEFEPVLIQGSFNARKKELKLNADIKKIVYGSTEINKLLIDVNSDSTSLNYKVLSTKISNAEIKLDNFLMAGKIADKKIMVKVSSMDELQNKKLFLQSQITRDKANYKITLNPYELYLMNERWDIAADNYVEFGKQGFLIHHLFLNKTESQINIASVHDKFDDDLNIEIKNFNLGDISRIIEKDTSLVKGDVDGNVLLKKVKNTYGIIADVQITDLFVREVPIGNLAVKADNPTAEKFNIDVSLSGSDNNLIANGYFMPNGGDNALNIKAVIQSLSMKTVEAFSMKTITNASGNLTGNFLIEGKATAPDITGELVFNNVFITPAALNNQLQLKHETIQLKKQGIYFNAFTILDDGQHAAVIDGNVQMKEFSDFRFALQVKTQDFLLFNTSAKDNTVFYGRMIIDSKIDINGPLSLPVINAKIKLKKGSNFTFAVPEENLTVDKGKNVVLFEDTLKLNSIISRGGEKKEQKATITGYDISSIIEIDKQATLRLLLDPASSDSLVVKGEAALSFAIDRSGKMSLTGTYNLNEGSYIVSLESVIKRKFDIEPGSTIIWNGDPLDAEISLNAIYTVRASPIDLVADQMSGLSEADKNEYKQRYPFLVYLKLRGEILHPEISFEIKLSPEDIGILGGAVNAKLNMLNEDPSALNKQVFALLVLGRFVQENPLQTESGGGVSSVVRTTVGKFLSAQLNQLSSKVVPGVELNFDIQSAEDYQSGVAEGSTQVDVGIKKQLFNERFTVQVGGTVDVEGEKAKQNSASNITSDVTVEYKLTEDGRYRLKGFRHNQYEGAIEGQLVETGVGVMFVRDFNKWKNLFKSPKNKGNKSKIINKNDTIKPE